MSLEDATKEVRAVREWEETKEEQKLRWTEVDYDIVKEFVNKICLKAEHKMLATGKLEGAHYAAMREVLEEYKEKAKC